MARKPSQKPVRRRAGRALRVVGATSTGVVAVGALAAATLFAGPWASALGTAPAVSTVHDVAVAPAPALLVCPPPAALAEGANVGDSQFTATPVETQSTVVAGVLGTGGDATWSPSGGDPAPLARGAAAAAGTAPATAGTVVAAVPGAGEPLRAAGATTSLTTAGDLRGLASAPCVPPAISQWIVGGGTEVGTTAVLVVQNPSERSATVTLDVFGPAGKVALGSRGTFLVGPGETTRVNVGAAAPDQRRIAVHVASTGARVAANLQVQSLAGLLPRGVDLLAPGAAPARSVTVAGVVSDGQPLDDPDAPVLRVLAPEGGPGTARVSIYGEDGITRLRGTESVELQPGVVTDVPLGGLPAGGYVVVVDADVDVVAAAGYSRAAATSPDDVVQGTMLDVAWAAGQPLPGPGDHGLVAVPAGTRPILTVGALPETRDGSDPTGDPVRATVRVYGLDGAVLTEVGLDLTPGTVQRTAVADWVGESAPALVSVDVDGSAEGRVAWALELSAGSDLLVSSVAPTPTAEAADRVRVQAVDAQDARR
ncbi:DUF5719 family protein [Xylanimonas protaetiae]|uniref:Large extracellular alpha-helical protein n=1 Tax=Xylanimonas protaetiae TaxID=2509457 RepID=A0A4P6F0D5_9MICO|nr:DUF5719 family protein [Xylanimonas protaetiae]QAY68884.1 hypothetical protein ET471_01515 [Xylanimonas protaetiae]